MAEPAKTEESSKIKDLLAAVNASSGVNKLGIKVDYAAGSMLEGSINELKHSAKLQVEYLSQLVGFQEQSLKDARLKSVQGDTTEKLQDKGGIGSDLANASKAGLDAAFAAGGPLGTIIGLITSGLVGATKLAFRAFKPSNARENADLTREEKTAQAKQAAEEKAKFEREKVRLKGEAEAKMAEAEKLRIEADGKMARAKADVLESTSGKKLSGTAEQAKRNSLFRQAEMSSREAEAAEVAARDAAEAVKAANATKFKPSGLTRSATALESTVAADTGETAAKYGLGRIGGLALAGARGLGTIAEVALGPEVLAAQLAAQIAFDPEVFGDKIGNADDMSGASMKELRDVIIPLFANKGNKAIPDVKKELKHFMTTFGGQDNFSDFGKTLHWLSEASDQELSNFAATVMRNSKTGPFNPKATINPKSIKNRAGMAMPLNDITNNRDRQNMDVRDRSLLTAPQSSSTPPIIIAPTNQGGSSSNMVNSNNTQNTTVIQKSDAPLTALQLGMQMLGYGFGSISMAP